MVFQIKSHNKIFLLIKSGTSSLLPFSDEAKKVWKLNQLKNIDIITCNFDTLDNFCNEMNIDFIDFMKIDVQGAEYLVLEGAEKLLSKKAIKNIQLEVIVGDTYLGQKGIGYYINLLEKYDYKLKIMTDFVIHDGYLISNDLFFTCSQNNF